MSRRKCKRQTKHGKIRLNERCNVDKSNQKAFVNNASIHGFNPDSVPNELLQRYLLNKKQYRNKRIKLYKGYVFVFNKTSNNLITMYPLPDNLMEIFNEMMKNAIYPNSVKK